MGCYGAGLAAVCKWNINLPGPQNPTVIRAIRMAENPYQPSSLDSMPQVVGSFRRYRLMSSLMGLTFAPIIFNRLSNPDGVGLAFAGYFALATLYALWAEFFGGYQMASKVTYLLMPLLPFAGIFVYLSLDYIYAIRLAQIYDWRAWLTLSINPIVWLYFVLSLNRKPHIANEILGR